MVKHNHSMEDIMEREQGLNKGLKTNQITMIAIGGAIGTGLFLGSSLAIGLAGPSVIVSYAIGALIALLLMGCLAEMTVAHPTTGSFGAYAEKYVNSWAGFAIRYSYWFSLICSIGTEVTAVALYMRYWFPSVPNAVWIILFAATLLYVNATTVKLFGAVEYWFSVIKITAIVGFIILASIVIFGADSSSNIGIQNYFNDGGFFPHGFWGMWMGIFISLFSYLSIEMIAVSAGEAENPRKAVPIALKSAVIRLILFYIVTLVLMLMIVPWGMAGADKSPFVKVMEILNIPGGASMMNFVVLIAALSAMNSQLYISTRMMFSLSRGGFAPKQLGKLNKRQVPTRALLASVIGIIIATAFSIFKPESALSLMISISSFGAMFAWFMIFITHLFFRKKYKPIDGEKLPVRMIGYPYLTILGAVLLASVVLSTWFSPDFKATLLVGFPWLIFISICYYIWKRINIAKNRVITNDLEEEQVETI
ncbi:MULTISPECIES: amino acid permease [unclassified Lysinibacillus]|uniref:amino acid permease n=1 Tax=unclassified Lysinibacillus TaxID=2636778 RepID=UPI00201B3CC9|nr:MULTISPECIES: amino acid permease [unclassified Lysinibacillus]